ncbi:bifunctional adenosylcobinamide kinase/adenosylcobinamide-phosphate guanylyltransferase [Escherichia albertii NBRC 107761 = DSM 17582]|uniref:Bifunctional adenosylcobalamin biosynthesis protein n=1 Tax=Escherichia albertii (strain TW07627) TaxID=502347 RepID=A0ABC9NMP1_ESCAT|nr:bifunctional adenosylcobinamide kinase/adenosylcobinamide-phosphate guanylyltransferase [Escherichia albertii]EDS91382.1 bifunctional adenosylcobalamin biosynthesis protein CobP [Escherichia albertii TW07627]EKG0291272.1 bifunctional adenosylcobinamide kinase/adenosylcobinamide-phosphate guanylyltransferase [Escherichia albertii]MCJ2196772.1 bifunctional adenosylcobinamide kinase/adenosylcobinamide-phosphate guanylyltransferase [Escherichia albertii NBRC 107761 = DSM 17582]MCZ8798939.1 bifun
MILVTGGARSGKSAHVEQLALSQCERVLYIATSVITDDEMAQRVKKHRAQRPAHWRTWEGYRDIGDVIRHHVQPGEGVVLECITTMLANLLYEASGGASPDTLDFTALEAVLQQQVDELITVCQQSSAPIFVVTNELGMSITPENRLARHFVDISGRANQKLAQAAQEVWLVVSGIGVKIKGS